MAPFIEDLSKEKKNSQKKLPTSVFLMPPIDLEVGSKVRFLLLAELRLHGGD